MGLHGFMNQYFLIPGLTLVLTLAACSNDRQESTSASDEGRVVAVTLVKAAREEVRLELYSVGRIVSRNAPTLAAEINARVIAVLVDEGHEVERGQLLVRLDTTAFELARREAQAEIQRLTASIANEERRVARYRDLKTRDMMPEERLDDAEAKLAVDRASLAAAEARLAIAVDRLGKAELLSPVEGIVEKRHISTGDYVQVGGALVSITDTRDLRAELPFPETVGHLVRPGQTLFIESPIAPGLVVEASVDHIRPQVGAMSRSLVVIADVENPGSWRPEATIEANLVADRRPNATVVPLSSVVKRPAGDVVYRVDPASPGQVQQVSVRTGLVRGDSVEILDGVAADDLIVADGAHYLSDGARIQAREASE